MASIREIKLWIELVMLILRYGQDAVEVLTGIVKEIKSWFYTEHDTVPEKPDEIITAKFVAEAMPLMRAFKGKDPKAATVASALDVLWGREIQEDRRAAKKSGKTAGASRIA